MKLSIITINYNNREGLRKTIDSVINQTWQDFEWIIVDGGSTDGSRELIEETARKLEIHGWTTEQFSGPNDPASFIVEQSSSTGPSSQIVSPSSSHRLLWCSEKDKGIYNAMNKGIVRAQGEYCLFLNSGDSLLDSNVLQMAVQNELDCDIVYGIAIEERNGTYQTKDIRMKEASGLFLYRGTLPHQATFIRRSLFEIYGMYDEGLSIVSDWKFCLQSVVFGTASIRRIPVEICLFEDGGVTSTQRELRLNERQSVLDSYFPPRVQNDLSLACSLSDVFMFSWSRGLYALLYRLVTSVNRHKL